MTCAKIAGCERENFKGKAFRLDHEQAWKCEPYHRTPVVKGAFGEAWPAVPTGDEANIDKEAYGE